MTIDLQPQRLQKVTQYGLGIRTLTMSDALLTSFKTAILMFGEEDVLGALRLQFADVCCETDVMIQKVIDFLDKKFDSCPDNYAIDIVSATLGAWIDQKEMTPDPWWAS